MIYILIAIISITWLSIFLSIKLGYVAKFSALLPKLKSENNSPMDAEIIE
jgi:hypothetical protein